MQENEVRKKITENWEMVREEVAAAAIAAGRSVEDVTVIGVTKYVDADWTVALADAGCLHLGENRPQVLWKKVESTDFPEPIQWHMIGHLQTNKVRRLLRYQPLIHSVDSTRLLEVIAEESVLKGIETKVLLEINISGDETKTGLTPSQAIELLGENLPDGVCLSGLMAMAKAISSSRARMTGARAAMAVLPQTAAPTAMRVAMRMGMRSARPTPWATVSATVISVPISSSAWPPTTAGC